MKYSMPIQDLIKKRKSVRTYTGEALNEVNKNELAAFMNELSGEEHRFELIDFSFKEGSKIGTYGMIKGANAYIVGIMPKREGCNLHASFRFGYDFEQIVLKATELGFGTCWMAATFNNGDVSRLVDLDSEEQVVMVSPIGYAGKKRTAEKLTRFFAKADNRKPWSELFFNQDETMPLSQADVNGYGEAFEMVRIAPSAANLQPWRIIKRNDKFEFYAATTSYASKPDQKIDMTYNDMGIALAHFELTAKELGLVGEWKLMDCDMTGLGEQIFVGTWKCK